MRHIFAMLISLYLLFAYNLYAVAGQRGESTYPPRTSEIITVPATLEIDPIQEIRIGSFKVGFEKTTLGEILNAVGVGSIQHAGDAGGYQEWLCYSLPSQQIWLISSEMGGGRLTQVQAILTRSPSQGKAACPEIPARFQSISMNFGWLGTTQENLFKALGQPSGRKDGRLMYFYAGKKPGLYGGQSVEWDVTSYVEVVIVDNKVSSLYASHVTSY